MYVFIYIKMLWATELFGRPSFLRAIHNALEAVRKDLVSIAFKHVPDASENTISRIQLEELYLSACEEACAWQYKVPDVDDQEEGILLLSSKHCDVLSKVHDLRQESPPDLQFLNF